MNNSRIITLVLGDILCFFISLFIMVLVETNGRFESGTIVFYIRTFFIPLLLTLLMCYVANLYEVESTIATPRSIGRFALAGILTGTVIALFFYLFSAFGITPKTNLIILAAAFFILLVGWRRLFFYLFSHSASRRVFFIGESPEAIQLQEAFKKHPHIGHTVGTATTLSEYMKNPTRADLLVLARDSGIQDIELAAQLAVPIITIRGAFEELFGYIPLTHFTTEEAFSLLEGISEKSKSLLYRLFEIVIALAILIISSPFLLLAAIFIVLEDGAPIFYTQERVGFKGNYFRTYKLRTMKKNAEAHGAQWAAKDDNRQTWVGRILRKTHIDEVPQMWNIIRGDIALVGPRPERPEFVKNLEKEIPFYFLRHAIKPGFTGWAQIKYRYARTIDDSRQKFEYDLYYLRHHHILLDLGILAKTVQIIFTH